MLFLKWLESDGILENLIDQSAEYDTFLNCLIMNYENCEKQCNQKDNTVKDI